MNPLPHAKHEQAKEELQRREKQLIESCRVGKQHSSGKLTARQRIELLLDKESFIELHAFQQQDKSQSPPGDAVITGRGTISGRQVFVYAQDFTQLGGTLGKVHAEKILSVMDLALSTGCPLISILDSGGARIQEGITALEGYAAIFQKTVKASGSIPQISIILGPCAGGASYCPGLTDFIFMVHDTSTMFITGPKVIKSVTGQETTLAELGGTQVHTEISGVAHFSFDEEKQCFAHVRRLLQYLPQNSSQKQIVSLFHDDRHRHTSGLTAVVPDNEQKPYDMHEVILDVADHGSFFEIQKDYAQNIIVGFATIQNRVVGIVGNQTNYMAGCLDIDASDKIARFVRFCDCFGIALINLVDCPGYLPGIEQEHKGIIRHGAKVLYAYAEATVPKISLVLRKAFGGAYIALAGKSLGYDITLAWPLAKIAVMGAEQAVEILHRKEVSQQENPEEFLAKKIEAYEKDIMNPYVAAQSGYIDRIITPENTRIELIRGLEMLKNKKRKKPEKWHGNMPV